LLYVHSLHRPSPRQAHSIVKAGEFNELQHCLAHTHRGKLRGLYSHRDNLPIYVLVAGIEGAGHGLLAEYFSLLESLTPLLFVRKSHNAHRIDLAQQAPYLYTGINLDEQSSHLWALAQDAFEQQSIIVDTESVFPMSVSGGSLNSPDLLHLLLLDGVLFDLRVIVLQRDPIHAVQSSVRRYYSATNMLFKTLEYQARVAEENLVYISNTLRLIPCENLVRIDFECFIHNASQYAGDLGRVLGIAPELLHSLPSPRYKASPNDIFLKDDIDILTEFMTSHASLWPGIGSGGLSAPAYHISTDQERCQRRTGPPTPVDMVPVPEGVLPP
jgi:hypothetical protein